MGTDYCSEHVSLTICLAVCEHISRTIHVRSSQLFVCVTHRSIPLQRVTSLRRRVQARHSYCVSLDASCPRRRRHRARGADCRLAAAEPALHLPCSRRINKQRLCVLVKLVLIQAEYRFNGPFVVELTPIVPVAAFAL